MTDDAKSSRTVLLDTAMSGSYYLLRHQDEANRLNADIAHLRRLEADIRERAALLLPYVICYNRIRHHIEDAIELAAADSTELAHLQKFIMSSTDSIVTSVDAAVNLYPEAATLSIKSHEYGSTASELEAKIKRAIADYKEKSNGL